MMSYNRIKSTLACVAVVAVMALMSFTGCTTTADYTLGQELAPTNQQMEMRHRLYRGGTLTEIGRDDAPCEVFRTRLFKTDSVQSASLTKFFLGVQHDPSFGTRKMGYASQFLHMSLVDDSVGFGYRPLFDSAMFLFLADTFVGDTMKPIKYNVYQLSTPLVADDAEDTLFYTSYDPRAMGHLAADAEPIFSFRFPDYANGVYTNSLKLRMKEEAGAKEFISKIFCMDVLDENGLANSNTEAYQSDSAFLAAFRGLWIEPDESSLDGEGSIFAFDTEESGFELYGRNRNAGVDADLIADTIDIIYRFYTDYAVMGNVSAQSVKHDYSHSEIEQLRDLKWEQSSDEVAMGYVDGCSGVITELYITDEFLYSLRNINSGDEEYVSAAINQAELKIYLENADYDYLVMDPVAMGEQMDGSIQRLGLYSDYKGLVPVVDYLYEDEANGSTIYFNGYLNRSTAAYEMNISSFIQSLTNEVLALEAEADGTLDFSKLTTPRTLYVAPSAYDRFTLNRSRLQGGDSSLTPASIDLSLTYTLVK